MRVANSQKVDVETIKTQAVTCSGAVTVQPTVGLAAAKATQLESAIDTAGVTAKFAGITSLAAWLRGLFRSSTMDVTAKTEVNTGGGTYNEATDSAEALGTTTAAVKIRTDMISAGAIYVRNQVVTQGGRHLTLRQGDSYTLEDLDYPHWTDNAGAWPDLSEADVTFRMEYEGATELEKECVVDDVGETIQSIRCHFDTSDTDSLTVSGHLYKFEVEAVWSESRHKTLIAGSVRVLSQILSGQ
jgi:hypothetical protein